MDKLQVRYLLSDSEPLYIPRWLVISSDLLLTIYFQHDLVFDPLNWLNDSNF